MSVEIPTTWLATVFNENIRQKEHIMFFKQENNITILHEYKENNTKILYACGFAEVCMGTKVKWQKF